MSTIYHRRGSIPIVLTCPHGGTEKPPNISKRKNADNCTGGDKLALKGDEHTAQITKSLARKILDSTNLSPYVVIANYHRRYIDYNRPPRCAFSEPAASIFYDEYHNRVASYVTQILNKNGNRGFLFDIHGTVRKSADVYVGTQKGKTLVSGLNGVDLFAEHGLCKMLTKKCKVIPANDITENLGSLNGGFTVRHYSSKMKINCIQIEISKTIRKSTRFRSDLADTLINFVRHYISF